MGFVPPWAVLAAVFVLSTYVQDLQELVGLTVSAAFGAIRGCKLGRCDSGCKLCHKITELVLKMTELDESGEIDCGKLCFGQKSCVDVCDRILSAMRSSTAYPCYAAGLCPVEDDEGEIVCHFDWRHLTCVDNNGITASCTRMFPARCVVNQGIQSWQRQAKLLARNAGLVARALQQQPTCGEPNAGPYCVHEPSGLDSACEVLCWALPFVVGTISSIRAVETPGGDDDRQWLTFWLIFFGFLGIERFTSILVSWFWGYYEVKLAILCWLMFRQGADKIYRAARRACVHSHRLVAPQVRPSRLLPTPSDSSRLLPTPSDSFRLLPTPSESLSSFATPSDAFWFGARRASPRLATRAAPPESAPL